MRRRNRPNRKRKNYVGPLSPFRIAARCQGWSIEAAEAAPLTGSGLDSTDFSPLELDFFRRGDDLCALVYEPEEPLALEAV